MTVLPTLVLGNTIYVKLQIVIMTLSKQDDIIWNYLEIYKLLINVSN